MILFRAAPRWKYSVLKHPSSRTTESILGFQHFQLSPQMVEPIDLYWKCGLANPHTTHCLGNGQIMISCLGDPAGNGKGESLTWSRYVVAAVLMNPDPAFHLAQVALSFWMDRLSRWWGTGSTPGKLHPLGTTSGTSQDTM